MEPDLPAENLVDGGRLFERAFFDDALAFLLHEEHERVEWFLDVLSSTVDRRRLQTDVVLVTRRPRRRRGRRHRR